LTFEELGVDRLFVDEAHYFENLFYVSKMTRIAGLPQTASERAFDMFLKACHIQPVNGGGGVVFATGTPIPPLTTRHPRSRSGQHSFHKPDFIYKALSKGLGPRIGRNFLCGRVG
jgi:hypothetical protein